jgi:hypothetical protein
MRKNYLISSTLNWNPGDDFIRMGVKRLLGLEHNYIVWNRNPDVMSLGGKARSNSAWNNIDVSLLDAVVFAGTPQWYGASVAGLVDGLLRHPQLPAYFIGVGMSRPASPLGHDMIRVLQRHTSFITTRGEQLTRHINKALGATKAVTRICPAAFCCEPTETATESTVQHVVTKQKSVE